MCFSVAVRHADWYALSRILTNFMNELIVLCITTNDMLQCGEGG
jgi:hypothetical protein